MSKAYMAEDMCGKNMFTQNKEESDMLKTIKRVLARDDDHDLETRIVGGHKSSAGRFPWMVTIGLVDHGLSCGGAIINKDWVMSASHCFEKR